MAAVAERIEADTTPREVPISYEWRFAQDAPANAGARFGAVRRDPDTDRGLQRQQPHPGLLRHASDGPAPGSDRLSGDSFVEGDILTADLRERLQSAFGGRPGGGAGFAPMASPLTAFRRTVKTQSKGWTTYNIMQRKSAPRACARFLRLRLGEPACGRASTRWESTDYRKRPRFLHHGARLFPSPRDSRVEVTLNDAQRRVRHRGR